MAKGNVEEHGHHPAVAGGSGANTKPGFARLKQLGGRDARATWRARAVREDYEARLVAVMEEPQGPRGRSARAGDPGKSGICAASCRKKEALARREADRDRAASFGRGVRGVAVGSKCTRTSSPEARIGARGLAGRSRRISRSSRRLDALVRNRPRPPGSAGACPPRPRLPGRGPEPEPEARGRRRNVDEPRVHQVRSLRTTRGTLPSPRRRPAGRSFSPSIPGDPPPRRRGRRRSGPPTLSLRRSFLTHPRRATREAAAGPCAAKSAAR